MEQFLEGVLIFLRSRVLLFGVLTYCFNFMYNTTGYTPFGIMSMGWFLVFLVGSFHIAAAILTGENTDKY